MSKPITPLRGLTPTLFSCRGTGVQPGTSQYAVQRRAAQTDSRQRGVGSAHTGQPVGEDDGEDDGDDVGGMPGVTGRVGRTLGVGVGVVVAGRGGLVAVGAGVGAGGDVDVRVSSVGGTLVGRAAGAKGGGAVVPGACGGRERTGTTRGGGVLPPDPDDVNGGAGDVVALVGSPTVGPWIRELPPATTVSTATAARAPPATPTAWSALGRPDDPRWARWRGARDPMGRTLVGVASRQEWIWEFAGSCGDLADSRTG